jgi:hypothetical protein
VIAINTLKRAQEDKGRAKIAAHIFSSGCAAAISGFLCLASLQYVMAMKPLGLCLRPAMAVAQAAPGQALVIDLKSELDALYSGYLAEAVRLSLAGLVAIIASKTVLKDRVASGALIERACRKVL